MKALKNYYYLIISVLVVFFLFSFFTKKKIEALGNNFSILQQGREKLTLLRKKSETLSSFDEISLIDQVNKLNYILPSEKSVAGLMASLDLVSQEASVSIKKITFSPGNVSSDKTKVNKENFDVSLEIQGKTEQIKNFLVKLKDSLMAFNVKGIKILKTKAQEGSGFARADLILTVYYKTVTQKLGEITKPVTLLTKEEEKLLLKMENISLPSVETSPNIPSGKTNPFD